MPGVNPVNAALTFVGLDPVTGLGVAFTVDPYKIVGPYSNVTVVLFPFALTAPFMVAVVFVIDVAAAAADDGGVEVTEFVVKLNSFPYAIPTLLVA